MYKGIVQSDEICLKKGDNVDLGWGDIV